MSDDDLDRAAWLQRLGDCVGNDHESMVSIVDGLLIEIPDMSERVKEAIAIDNAAEVQRCAHTLKSSLKYISTGPEVGLADQIETCGRENLVSDASSLMLEIQPHLDQWQARLQTWFDAQ